MKYVSSLSLNCRARGAGRLVARAVHATTAITAAVATAVFSKAVAAIRPQKGYAIPEPTLRPALFVPLQSGPIKETGDEGDSSPRTWRSRSDEARGCPGSRT